MGRIMLLSQIAHGQVLQGYHLRCQTAILQSGNRLHLDFRKSRQLHDYISAFMIGGVSKAHLH
jgi:hypothetical protein